MTDTANQLESQRNDPSFSSIVDELEWRGLISVSTDRTALRNALDSGAVTYYCGFDPTAGSLHVGHLVQLLSLRRLQLAGHHPLALVGGATGLIGDPRPTAERTLHDPGVVAGWVDSLGSQIRRFLSAEGDNAVRMVNNLDWTKNLTAIDLLRGIGKNFRVGAMLAKDAVSARLKSEAGISYTEFSYQVLQANDFLELFRRYGCTLQTGGQDQWGNLVGGVDLVRRVEGAIVHAFGTPLITNADGTKFGKSEGNAVWLDPQLTTPYAFYQFWLNSDDADVVHRLKVFTFLTRAEIEELAVQVRDAPQRRDAQRRLAWELTALVHGPDAARSVQQASQALFGHGDITLLDAVTLDAALGELPHADGAVGEPVTRLLAEAGLVKSLGEARRAIAQGGVSVNNERVDTDDAVLTSQQVLAGGWVLLRRGKKTLGAVRVRG